MRYLKTFILSLKKNYDIFCVGGSVDTTGQKKGKLDSY